MNVIGHVRARIGAFCLAAALYAISASLALAVDLDQQVTFDIPAGTLSKALIAFSTQAHVQVLSSGEHVARGKTDGLIGTFTIREALNRLLSGSGLSFRSMNTDAIAIDTATSDGAQNRRGRAIPDDSEVPIALVAVNNAASTSPQLLNEADKPAQSQLAEVVVTATKRSEDILRVPMSVTALSGDQLLARQIVSLDDLTRSVPGLSFSGGGGPGLNNIEIRGVSSSAGSATVAIYLDDAPITVRNLFAVGSTEPRFFDLNSVEVLRGPQGTLYGASSMGGAIKFITNQPQTTDFSTSVRSDVSTTEHGRINNLEEGIVNIPLVSGVVALRAGVQFSEDSGYINRVSPVTGSLTDRNINSSHTVVSRVALKIAPNSDLSIVPAVFYQRVTLADTSVFDLGLPNFQTTKLVPETTLDTFTVPSLTVNYDMDWARLTTVSSYFTRKLDRVEDGTYENAQYLGSVLQTQEGYGGGAFNYLYSPGYFNTRDSTFTQEIRLASKDLGTAPGSVSWITGVYYSDNKRSFFDSEFVDGFNSTVQSVYGQSALALLGSTFPNDNVYYSTRRYDERQEAVFGEATVRISRSLRLTLGTRFLTARESLWRMTAPGYFTAGLLESSSASNETAFTPKLTLAYDLTDQNSAYLTVAKGSRLGGPNRPIPVGPCASDLHAIGLTSAPGAYTPDSLWNYEIGSKNRFLDRRLSLDVSAYLIDWKNIQQDLVLSGCGFDFFANVGTARSYGSELEINARPIPEWTLAVTGSYTHAAITEPIPSLGIAKGADVLGVPQYSGTISSDYSIFVRPDLKVVSRIDYQRTGPSRGAFFVSNPDFNRPSYGVADASLTLNEDRWDMGLFARNLFDQDKAIQHPVPFYVPYGITVRPRTIGVSAHYKW
jgi:iron complex outermembrane recepter protein